MLCVRERRRRLILKTASFLSPCLSVSLSLLVGPLRPPLLSLPPDKNAQPQEEEEEETGEKKRHFRRRRRRRRRFSEKRGGGGGTGR